MSSDRLFVHTSRAHIRTSHPFGVARLIRKCFSLFRPRSSSHSAVRFDTVRPPQTRSRQLRSSLFRVRTPSSCPYTSAVAPRRDAGYCDRRVCLSVHVSPLAYPPPRYLSSRIREIFCVRAKRGSGSFLFWRQCNIRYVILPVSWMPSCLHHTAYTISATRLT